MRNQFIRPFLLIAALAAAIALPAVPVFAQEATCNGATVPVCSIGVGVVDVQITPQGVPTSTTTVAAVDAYLKGITVANTTSGALTFTLCDKQGSPVCVLTAVSIGANTTYVIHWPTLYWCPGGFTVAASSTGLIVYGTWKQ